MRIALIGAVKSTEVALKAMAKAGHAPVVLVTLPLGRAGRHSDFVDLRPLASALGILVIESHQINSPECLASLRSLALDHLFVIGWSQIFGPDLLSIPKSGSVGYHPARLPECRGRAVLPWTILLRKRATGSTLFWLDESTDSGDIIGQECFEVAEDETSATLYEKHMEVLDRLVFQAVKDLAAGQKPAIPQDHSQATYCAKRTERDGLIDWKDSADNIWCAIRALGDPYPGAFTFHRGKHLVLHAAELVPQAPYIGIPGQIQRLDKNGALVLCGDGAFINITSAGLRGDPIVPPQTLLKVHDVLGLDLLALHERSLESSPQ